MNPVAVGEILADMVVEQSFVCDTSSIDTISIKFATYQRINTAKVEVELWNAQKNQKIEQWEFSAEELSDNGFKELQLSQKQQNTKGERYIIIVKSPDGVLGNAITMIASESNSYEQGELLVNGQERPGDVFFKLNNLKKNELVKYNGQNL